MLVWVFWGVVGVLSLASVVVFRDWTPRGHIRRGRDGRLLIALFVFAALLWQLFAN
jgi:hypothetical protein